MIPKIPSQVNERPWSWSRSRGRLVLRLGTNHEIAPHQKKVLNHAVPCLDGHTLGYSYIYKLYIYMYILHYVTYVYTYIYIHNIYNTMVHIHMLNVKHCETLPLERSTADGPTRVNYWMFLRIDWSKPGWWWLKGCVMFKSMTHVCCLWMFIVPSFQHVNLGWFTFACHTCRTAGAWYQYVYIYIYQLHLLDKLTLLPWVLSTSLINSFLALNWR
jgi:hypothetical protein